MAREIFQYHLKNWAQQITPTQLYYKATRRSSCLLLKTRSKSSVSYLMNSRDKLFDQENIQRHKLVVTGEDPCPIEVSMKGKRSRFDLETKHEEANIIIIHQVLYCAEQARQIAVMSDDTDVESHGKKRAILDIKATLAKHQQVMITCYLPMLYQGVSHWRVTRALERAL